MKLSLSLFVLAVFGGFSAIYASLTPSSGATAQGVASVVVIDASGETVVERQHAFEENDTLADILAAHHDARFDEHPIFGRKLLALEGIETDFHRDFIEILIDGAPSRTGIDGIPLEDDVVYTFVHRTLEGKTAE